MTLTRCSHTRHDDLDLYGVAAVVKFHRMTSATVHQVSELCAFPCSNEIIGQVHLTKHQSIVLRLHAGTVFYLLLWSAWFAAVQWCVTSSLL